MPDRHLWTRHSTKTITFTGAAGAGAVGTVTVFTLTGRVLVHQITGFCTSDLTEAGATATLLLGVTGDTDCFQGSLSATTIDEGEWYPGDPAASGIADATATTSGMGRRAVAGDIIITVGTQAVTGGVIVFDVIYTPLTDGARLF